MNTPHTAVPRSPELAEDEVHVWQASLGLPPPQLDRLRALLSEDERHRAERFRGAEHAAYFVAARGLLRATLALYLDTAPESLNFRYGPHGKPYLAAGDLGLRFNLSHSHGLAYYAIALEREVGIDIERVRAETPCLDLARRFFSKEESAAITALAPAQQSEAFFRCWTRKEAYIKARGTGLSLPLAQFTVTCLPGVPARLLRTEGDPEQASRWSLADLTPPAGYVGALAAEGTGWRIRHWDTAAWVHAGMQS
jgi:4'-phosphopantetheinyl transferase